MRDRIRRELAKMRRVRQFVVDHPLTPANAAAEEESAALSNAIEQVEEMAEDQSSGAATVSGAVDLRLVAVDRLLSLMSSLAKAAKVLDASRYPDVASKMRMGGIKSFGGLLIRANLFHSTVQPIAGEFIALGAAGTVLADLKAAITAVEKAGTLKYSGLDRQVGGTAGMAFASREGLKHVRKLDAILCQVYRTNPVMLAQWKTACRMERAPARESGPEKAAEMPEREAEAETIGDALDVTSRSTNAGEVLLDQFGRGSVPPGINSTREPRWFPKVDTPGQSSTLVPHT